MPININGVQILTSAEQLILWQNASAQLAISASVQVNGRMLTRANVAEVQSMISFWEERIALESDNTGGNIALVRYGDANGGPRRSPWS